MKKKIGIIRLRLESGKATAGPPVGPALGQRGLNIMEFCKKFNSKTNSIIPSILLPVLIIFYNDKSYDFFIKRPTVSCLLKNILNINKFPNSHKIDSNIFVDYFKIKEILSYKFIDFNTSNIYCAFKIIIGTLRSMSILLN